MSMDVSQVFMAATVVVLHVVRDVTKTVVMTTTARVFLDVKRVTMETRAF